MALDPSDVVRIEVAPVAGGNGVEQIMDLGRKPGRHEQAVHRASKAATVATIVSVSPPDAAIWDIYVASEVDLGEPFHASTDRFWPHDLPRMLVVTAYNPQSAVLDHSENETRSAQMRALLSARSIRHIEATGRSSDHSWSEPGFGLLDADFEFGLELLRRFDQKAMFELADGRLKVFAADGSLMRTREIPSRQAGSG